MAVAGAELESSVQTHGPPNTGSQEKEGKSQVWSWLGTVV